MLFNNKKSHVLMGETLQKIIFFEWPVTLSSYKLDVFKSWLLFPVFTFVHPPHQQMNSTIELKYRHFYFLLQFYFKRKLFLKTCTKTYILLFNTNNIKKLLFNYFYAPFSILKTSPHCPYFGCRTTIFYMSGV